MHLFNFLLFFFFPYIIKAGNDGIKMANYFQQKALQQVTLSNGADVFWNGRFQKLYQTIANGGINSMTSIKNDMENELDQLRPPTDFTFDLNF